MTKCGHFALSGKGGSLLISDASCWTIRTAFSDVAMPVSLSIDANESARWKLKVGTPRLANCSSKKDDPTSLWWNRWFEDDGFGGYDAVNLYPFCTSSPAECRRIVATADHGASDVRDDMHFVNLAHVVAKAKAASKVFVCWGAIAWDIDWVDYVVEEIQSGEAPYPDLWCWGTTQSGAPKHPMARANTASRHRP